MLLEFRGEQVAQPCLIDHRAETTSCLQSRFILLDDFPAKEDEDTGHSPRILSGHRCCRSPCATLLRSGQLHPRQQV